MIDDPKNTLFCQELLDYTAWQGTHEQPWMGISVYARCEGVKTALAATVQMVVNSLFAALLLLPYAATRPFGVHRFGVLLRTAGWKMGVCLKVLGYSLLATLHPSASRLHKLSVQNRKNAMDFMEQGRKEALDEIQAIILSKENCIASFKEAYLNRLKKQLAEYNLLQLEAHHHGPFAEYRSVKRLLDVFVVGEVDNARRLPTNDLEEKAWCIQQKDWLQQEIDHKLDLDETRILQQHAHLEKFNPHSFKTWLAVRRDTIRKEYDDKFLKLATYVDIELFRSNWKALKRFHGEKMDEKLIQLFNNK